MTRCGGAAERKTFGAGAAIFSEGDTDASLFVPVSGEIRIDKQVNLDQQQTLQRLRAGEFCGEISFVLGGPHVATAQVLPETEVLRTMDRKFVELVGYVRGRSKK